MPIESRGGLAPDPNQAALRDALKQAARYVALKDILNLAADHAAIPRASLLGERALRNFLGSDTAQLTKANYDALAVLWLASPIGRALRKLDPAKAEPFDHIMRALANGIGTMPDGVQAAGRYFMYHGSYLRADRYVVRCLTIEGGDDRVLTVEDIVRDAITVADTARRASGVMLFVEGRPQILLYGDENKQGLSLLIGQDISTRGGMLDRVFGAFMVMNQDRKVAYRPCLLIRDDSLPADAMIAESGIFTAAQLGESGRARHVAAFDRLRELMETQSFPDPMLTYRHPEATNPT